MNPEDAMHVDRMAATAMGVAQEQPAPNIEPPKTPTEQITSEAAPVTEADAQRSSPVVYEMEDKDGNKIPVTADQYFGMKERYGKLNYEHANLKPVTDLAKSLMQTHRIDAKTTADLLHKLANEPINKGDNTPKPDEVDALSQWESDNGVDSKPIRDNQDMMKMMQAQIDRQNKILEAMMTRQAGVTDAARDAMQNVNQRESDVMNQTFANNMNLVQQKFGFTDEQYQNFVDYYKERGYVEEDMIDPFMAVRVGQDFSNNMQAPQLKRLREQAERRMASTGSIGSSPSSGQAAAGPQGDSDIDRIASSIMAKRNPSM